MAQKLEWDTKVDLKGKSFKEIVQFAEEHHFASDAYSFAEWLTQSQEHFGPLNDNTTESDAESMYDEAMGWWNNAHR